MSDWISDAYGFRQPDDDRLPEISVLYRHHDWIAVTKPAGLAIHETTAAKPPLLVRLADELAVARLWLVHRLDKVTSGVWLLACSAEAAARLGRYFADGQVTKTYWAVAMGKPLKKQGWIKGDMAKSRRGAWKLLRSQNRPAVTYFDSHSVDPGLRCYRLEPHTGRTHQLRVAMKSLGCPILGDTLYGGAAADRVYLHAQQLLLPAVEQAPPLCVAPPAPWPADWRPQ